MPFQEQKDMIEDLRDYQDKMNRDELEDFEMFLKRHNDDEELDSLSIRRLKEFHEKYILKRPRKPFIDPFKK